MPSGIWRILPPLWYDQYTEGRTAQLEDPDNGTVTLSPGYGVFDPYCRVTVYDVSKPADIILTDPEGNTYRIPAIVEESSSGKIIIY